MKSVANEEIFKNIGDKIQSIPYFYCVGQYIREAFKREYVPVEFALCIKNSVLFSFGFFWLLKFPYPELEKQGYKILQR